jgi:hypothetical protein
MTVPTRLGHLLAAMSAVLIIVGLSRWDWSRDDVFPPRSTLGVQACLAVLCAYLPYSLLLRIARRFRDDPDGLLLWWMAIAPPLALAPFVAVTVGLTDAYRDGTVLQRFVPAMVAGLMKYEVVLATVYGYTGQLLLKVASARSPAAS